jgi:hypothetical protein
MNWDPIILGLGFLLVAAGGIAFYIQVRKKFPSKEKLSSVPYSEVTKDWELTGRINVTGPPKVMVAQAEDVSALFYIQVEEKKFAVDIGGGKYMELRWRLPTRSEVKEIVKFYNSIRLPSTMPKYGIEENESMIAGGEKSSPGIESERIGAITDATAKS